MMRQPRSRSQKVGSIQPIMDLQDVERIRRMLWGRPRDLLLFDLATRMGFRVRDLLRLRVGDLTGLRVGDELSIGQRGRTRHRVVMDEVVCETFQRYLRETDGQSDDYLFRLRRGTKSLDASQVSRMIRGWFEAAGLGGLSGSRSLRKTWEVHYGGMSSPRETVSEVGDFMEVLRPVESVTLQERVYRELANAIVSGRIPPGEKLVTERIAEQLQVSHMPVREALHRLEARGFLVAHKKRGYVLRELSKENLREITQIRLFLEPLAAEASCLKMGERMRDRLKRLHEGCERAAREGDMDEFLRLNKQFHFTIYRGAGMPILQELVGHLWDRISPYLSILCRGALNFDSVASCQNHWGMIEGMKRRDAKGVSEWVRRDVMAGAEALERLFVDMEKG